MLVAHAKVKGKDVFFVGLTPKQLGVMATGKPIIVAEESHPGLPSGAAMVVFTGKDDQALLDVLEKKGVVEDALAVQATEKVTLPKRTYPDGRMNEDDDGELTFRAAVDERKGLVILDWGKPVKWIALPPADVVQLCNGLLEKARSIDPSISMQELPPQTREPVDPPKPADMIAPDTWIGFKAVVDWLLDNPDVIATVFVRDINVLWRFGLWAGAKSVPRGRGRSEPITDALQRRRGGLTFGVDPSLLDAIAVYITGKAI